MNSLVALHKSPVSINSNSDGTNCCDCRNWAFDLLTRVNIGCFPDVTDRRTRLPQGQCEDLPFPLGSSPIKPFSLRQILIEQSEGIKLDPNSDRQGISIACACRRLGIPILHSFEPLLTDSRFVPEEIAEQLWGRTAQFGMKLEYDGQSFVIARIMLMRRSINLLGAPEGETLATIASEIKNFLLGIENLEIFGAGIFEQFKDEFEDKFNYLSYLISDGENFWWPNEGDLIPRGVEIARLSLIDAAHMAG